MNLVLRSKMQSIDTVFPSFNAYSKPVCGDQGTGGFTHVFHKFQDCTHSSNICDRRKLV